MRRALLIAVCACSALASRAALLTVHPKDGSGLSLLTEVQKRIMVLPTYESRLDALRNDKAIEEKEKRFYGRHNSAWRRSEPLVVCWKATAGEKGPWKIEIGKRRNLVDAKVLYFNDSDVKVGRAAECQCEIPRANLEIGTTYFWRVTGNVHCPDGRCNHDCCCKLGRPETMSNTSSFETEGLAPRWIALEGRVANVRDLGGRMTVFGKRVRQGLVFRGQELNDKSVTGAAKGRNRLTVADVNCLVGDFGIKTDLDLRNLREVGDLSESPLGPTVNFVHRSSFCYGGIFTEQGKKAMAENFRLFCDKANYPVYFHCVGGADRTGALAYVLNGVLGVDRHDLETDWEATFYPVLPEMRDDYTGKQYWCRKQHFDIGLCKYGDGSTAWHKRVELYLLDCGVAKSEVDAFRKIMLEGE